VSAEPHQSMLDDASVQLLNHARVTQQLRAPHETCSRSHRHTDSMSDSAPGPVLLHGGSLHPRRPDSAHAKCIIENRISPCWMIRAYTVKESINQSIFVY